MKKVEHRVQKYEYMISYLRFYRDQGKYHV